MSPAVRFYARTLPLALVLGTALAACVTPPPTPDMREGAADASPVASGPVPITFDDNRVFVPVTLIGVDGRERRTLALVNQGFAGPTLANALYRELASVKDDRCGCGWAPPRSLSTRARFSPRARC